MPFIPTAEIKEGSKGPDKAMRTERHNPASTRKEIFFLATAIVTGGSAECPAEGEGRPSLSSCPQQRRKAPRVLPVFPRCRFGLRGCESTQRRGWLPQKAIHLLMALLSEAGSRLGGRLEVRTGLGPGARAAAVKTVVGWGVLLRLGS